MGRCRLLLIRMLYMCMGSSGQVQGLEGDRWDSPATEESVRLQHETGVNRDSNPSRV
jgi:hypothetical protein